MLADGGDAYFDVDTLEISSERFHKYNIPDFIPTDQDYTWRRAVGFLPNDSLIKRLLFRSLKNAHPKSECDFDCLWTIYHYDQPSRLLSILSTESPWEYCDELITFNCNKHSDPIRDIHVDANVTIICL